MLPRWDDGSPSRVDRAMQTHCEQRGVMQNPFEFSCRYLSPPILLRAPCHSLTCRRLNVVTVTMREGIISSHPSTRHLSARFVVRPSQAHHSPLSSQHSALLTHSTQRTPPPPHYKEHPPPPTATTHHPRGTSVTPPPTPRHLAAKTLATQGSRPPPPPVHARTTDHPTATAHAHGAHVAAPRAQPRLGAAVSVSSALLAARSFVTISSSA